MRRLTLLLVMSAALVACRGCDDSTPKNNTTNVDPTACVDSDDDGFGVGAQCEGPTDCDDDDADVHPDADEVCDDGLDNNCDSEIDEGCLVEPPCEEGASRECGKDVGRCTLGSQTCTAGAWTTCDGVPATSETCNGEDDDCDGETDENPVDLCDDGLICNGVSTCENGACGTPVELDCTEFDGLCTQGLCSEKDRSCRSFPVPSETPCDDGLFCTESGSCDAGVCVTTPRDCSGEDDACNVGVCDEAAGACVAEPKADGITCDDGAFCTTGDTCTAGVCSGPARDCDAAGDQCNSGICDEALDICAPMPVGDGTACEDGAYCTVADTCIAGGCVGGGPRQCGAVGGSCRDGVCDETLDTCTGDPVADGTVCEDGQFCTSGDTCIAGNCTGGGPRDCSAANGVCRLGTCNETTNVCVPAPMADGTTCSDGLFCTTNDRCTAGMCGGTALNCASAVECTVGSCAEAAGGCVVSAVADGSACSDGDFCTVPDTCTAGVCGGPPRDCSNVSDSCNVGTCSGNACVPVPKANDIPCSTPLYCTVNTRCLLGVCTGSPRDCSGANTMCLDGVCDEGINTCATVDNGMCDVCLMSRPTSDAGPDQSAVPNQVVMLDASGSTDPTGQTLTYTWRIASAPVGSSAQLSSTNSRRPALLADLSGTFVVCVAVRDTDSCVATEDCMNIAVAPLVGLHIELVWFSDKSDMDLHYQAPNYGFSRWFGTTGVVWYGVPTPDWGGGATGDSPDGIAANNPRLDLDNTTGFGPENINQSNLFDGNPFTIGVHFFTNTDATALPNSGPTNARVRVFESGNPVPIFERTRLLKCQDFWEVANVRVTGSGTSVAVTAKDTVTAFDPVAAPTCRCTSNSDCRTGESCRPHLITGSNPAQYTDLCAP